MSTFHNNHGPMISGGCGSQFQLIITNPTGPAGSSLANTARYHGLASGQSAAAASESSTELTNRSCPGATRRARTASRFWSVISSRVTATSARLQATAAASWRGQAWGRDVGAERERAAASGPPGNRGQGGTGWGWPGTGLRGTAHTGGLTMPGLLLTGVALCVALIMVAALVEIRGW